MILYLDDWKRYPTAIVDTRTKNRTFVELADKYRQLGIKNYFFHLALLQPDLQGVDPYDPNLSASMMAKITAECKNNPWYFFREVFRLPSQGSPDPDPLRANRGNIGVYWCYFNHVDTALIQPRQTGKSVGADGVNTYVTQVAGRRATFSLITKDHDLRSKNVQRLKDMRDLLPNYINPYMKNIDTNNPFGISVHRHDNKFTTGVAQNSESQALNLGRGSTSESNQIDEGPFCKYIHVTIPAFLSSANAARENAARNGSFYGNIFTTTAGKLDTVEGKYMHDMFIGGMQFDERSMFDCKDESELHTLVERQSKGNKPLVYICLSHRQLGYTDEWLYKKMAESNSVGDEADRDYMNRWTTGSLSSPLSQSLLEAIKNSIRNADYLEMSERMYCINWYIPKDRVEAELSNNVTVLGTDMSEAVGKDSITMYLTNSETLETIFTVNICETNIYNFIEWYSSLMIKYPKMIAIPERKSVGVTLIDALIVKLCAANINPFKRIYNTIVEDGLHKNDEEYRFVHRDPLGWPDYVIDKYKSKFGYATSGAGRHSRNNLYRETLTRAAELTATKLYDNGLCTEIAGLVVKNARIDHASSGHDDMVIAWLLSMWFLLHSKNLDFYGITNPAGKALPYGEIIEASKPMTELDKVLSDEQTRLSTRIKALSVEIAECEDNILAEALEVQLINLSRRLKAETVDNKTIGDLIKGAREARANQIQERRAELDGSYGRYGASTTGSYGYGYY